MITIYECSTRVDGRIIIYLAHGDGEYAWVISHTTDPVWAQIRSIKTIMKAYNNENYSVVGEVESKDDVLPYIKMYRLIEV